MPPIRHNVEHLARRPRELATEYALHHAQLAHPEQHVRMAGPIPSAHHLGIRVAKKKKSLKRKKPEDIIFIPSSPSSHSTPRRRPIINPTNLEDLRQARISREAARQANIRRHEQDIARMQYEGDMILNPPPGFRAARALPLEEEPISQRLSEILRRGRTP